MKKLKICYHLFSFYHFKWLVLLDIDWTDNLVGCLFTIVEEDHIVALKSQGGFSGFDWANLNPQLTISVKPDIWMLIMIYIVAVMKTIYRNRAWIIFQVFVCVQSGTLIHDMHIHMHMTEKCAVHISYLKFYVWQKSIWMKTVVTPSLIYIFLLTALVCTLDMHCLSNNTRFYVRYKLTW